MTKEELEICHEQRKRRWDNAAVKKQKFIEGEENKAREIALAFKKMGLPNEQISEGIGLSIEEIEKL